MYGTPGGTRRRGAVSEEGERSGGDGARSYSSHDDWRAERAELERGGGGGGAELSSYYPHYVAYPSARRFSSSFASDWRRTAVDSPVDAADRMIRPHVRGGARPLHPETTQTPSPVPMASGRDPEPEPNARTRSHSGRSNVTLTEADRQDIMARIRKGEKQADLAKEYRVSRAAITNLKQRRQMLEMLARRGEEERKRRRVSEGDDGGGGGGAQDMKMTAEEPEEQSESGSTAHSVEMVWPRSAEVAPILPLATTDRPPLVRELSSTTTSRLLATLMDSQSTDDAFLMSDLRLGRLLLEESIGLSFSVATGHNSVHKVDHEVFKPVGVALGEYEGPRFLREYAQLEPAAATATLWPLVVSRTSTTERAVDITVRIPSTVLTRTPVLVFLDAFLGLDENPDLSSPDPTHERPVLQQLLFAIHALVFSGVSERHIIVIVDVCPLSVAQAMAQRFPELQIITVRLVNPLTDADEVGSYKQVHQRRRQLMQPQQLQL